MIERNTDDETIVSTNEQKHSRMEIGQLLILVKSLRTEISTVLRVVKYINRKGARQMLNDMKYVLGVLKKVSRYRSKIIANSKSCGEGGLSKGQVEE